MEKTARISAVQANLPRMGPCVLLVEGTDDWHSINHLVNSATGKFPSFELGHCVNDNGVLDLLSAVTEASGLPQKVLGAVLDADTEIQAKIRSLQGRLGRYYPIPSNFPAEGLVVAPSREFDSERLPRLGIWLMPDNIEGGIFEDLLRSAMGTESESYVSRVVDQAKTDGMADFRDVGRSKAIVKTHIVWQDPNKKNLGEAIGTHFADLVPACNPFLNWLDALFGKAPE